MEFLGFNTKDGVHYLGFRHSDGREMAVPVQADDLFPLAISAFAVDQPDFTDIRRTHRMGRQGDQVGTYRAVAGLTPPPPSRSSVKGGIIPALFVYRSSVTLVTAS